MTEPCGEPTSGKWAGVRETAEAVSGPEGTHRALHLGSQGESRFPEGKAQWWQLPEKLGLQKSTGRGKWDSGGHSPSRSRESCGRSLISMV